MSKDNKTNRRSAENWETKLWEKDTQSEQGRRLLGVKGYLSVLVPSPRHICIESSLRSHYLTCPYLYLGVGSDRFWSWGDILLRPLGTPFKDFLPKPTKRVYQSVIKLHWKIQSKLKPWLERYKPVSIFDLTWLNSGSLYTLKAALLVPGVVGLE